MTDDESPKASNPACPADRLLAIAENSPGVRARLVERWAQAEAWTLVEGIALAWTLDPTILGKTELLRTPPESALPEDARHYLELARRSSALSREPVTPKRFIEWAYSAGLAFHSDWRDAAGRAASEISRSRALEANQRRQLLIRRWARAPYWDPAEGAALASDLDPKEAIRRSAGGYDRSTLVASADAQHLLELARRAIAVGALNESAAPIEFMTWARSIAVEFHPDWWNAVVDAGAVISGEPEAPSPVTAVSELKTRERDTLLKLVIGMAMAGYGWNPSAARNDAIAEIASDLELRGISLSQDTIRKWLRAGVDLLPRDD